MLAAQRRCTFVFRPSWHLIDTMLIGDLALLHHSSSLPGRSIGGWIDRERPELCRLTISSNESFFRVVGRMTNISHFPPLVVPDWLKSDPWISVFLTRKRIHCVVRNRIQPNPVQLVVGVGVPASLVGLPSPWHQKLSSRTHHHCITSIGTCLFSPFPSSLFAFRNEFHPLDHSSPS